MRTQVTGPTSWRRRRAHLAWKPLLLAVALLGCGGAAADEGDCGALTNATGPFDYRRADPRTLATVEAFHFSRDVESLRKGKSGYLGGDLDFVLRTYPNHTRALAAMMALQFKTGKENPLGASWPVPCYFDRAIRFAPDDGSVRVVMGIYLLRQGKTREAIDQLEMGSRMGEDSGNMHYNLGLAYFAVGDFEQSVAHAKKAYALGFDLPALKNKLVKAGKWPPE